MKDVTRSRHRRPAAPIRCRREALAQFTRALAPELAPDGVRVNALAPEELAGPVVFLCSDAASYITGAILPVDREYLGI